VPGETLVRACHVRQHGTATSGSSRPRTGEYKLFTTALQKTGLDLKGITRPGIKASKQPGIGNGATDGITAIFPSLNWQISGFIPSQPHHMLACCGIVKVMRRYYIPSADVMSHCSSPAPEIPPPFPWSENTVFAPSRISMTTCAFKNTPVELLL
jgi:hypothetical protein